MVAKMKKRFYKFMTNAVYGKAMENLKNRVDLRVLKKDYLKWASKSNLVTQKNFKNNLVAIHKI